MSMNASARVAKLGAKLFIIFSGVVAVIYALAQFLESRGFGLNNYIFWLFVPLLKPAIIIRRWLFEIPGAEEEYHYYAVIGPIDYIGLFVFYFLMCLVLAWSWTWIKSRICHD